VQITDSRNPGGQLDARFRGVALEHGVDAIGLDGGGALEGRDQRERALALLEVGAHRLAEAALVGHEVERIVADLEGDADGLTVTGKRVDLGVVGLGEESPDTAASRDEGRRLLGDDSQVVGLARRPSRLHWSCSTSASVMETVARARVASTAGSPSATMRANDFE
jgi:hypothetical protein